MSIINQQKHKNILIASIQPYFLEKEAVWFEKNLNHILKARKTQMFWQENTLFLEKGQTGKMSDVLRKLDTMGYEKVFKADSWGEFSQTGGVIDVFPINSLTVHRLDFLGNAIETICPIGEPITDEKTAKNQFQKKLKRQKMFADLKGIMPGNYLVHLDHGIGKFLRICNFPVRNAFGIADTGGQVPITNSQSISNLAYRQTCLPPGRTGFQFSKKSEKAKGYYALEYAQGDKLYVPVGLERKLSRYVGFVEPKLNRLGSILWQKTKRKIKEDAEKFAQELLKAMAQKETAKRPIYSQSELSEAIASGFQYELTADQEQTINEIGRDLLRAEPMDRIVCGDVGFGKTEIALRTATRVAENNCQVVLIAPTTILANQHYFTFAKRLKNLPVKVGLLTRLQSPSEKRSAIEAIKTGKIDILIGTHSVLSKGLVFKNLGLLIVDDEQKFGVKQKELLRQKYPFIDVLYLSATPIPRTLYLALSSLKNLSFIKTAPEGRRPIKTFVLPFSSKIIKQALQKEIKRNGQVYFLHNRIETIISIKEKLQEIAPFAKTAVLHAKLPEHNIIEVLNDFQAKKYNVLLSTTIIENGIDLANVNTLIVDDAARLGLSQAHQLRGRVGRAEKQAFAYFFYKPKTLKGKAKQRLLAIKSAQALGAGYHIALRDMEIRGSGNILGKEQSGSVNKVGLNLYCQMLSQAMDKIREVAK